MNRRAFLSLIGLAPAAAVVAPAIRGVAESNGTITTALSYGVQTLDAVGSETILPTYPNGIPQVSVEVWPHDRVSYDTAARGLSREEIRKWSAPLLPMPDVNADWPEW